MAGTPGTMTPFDFDLVTPARRRQRSELGSAKQMKLCVRAVLAFCLCILLAGCPGPKFNPPPAATPSPTSTPAVTPSPTATPTPPPTPLPEAIIPYSHKDVARLFS